MSLRDSGGIHESEIAVGLPAARLQRGTTVRNEAGASAGYLNNSRFFHESRRSI